MRQNILQGKYFREKNVRNYGFLRNLWRLSVVHDFTSHSNFDFQGLGLGTNHNRSAMPRFPYIFQSSFLANKKRVFQTKAQVGAKYHHDKVICVCVPNLL